MENFSQMLGYEAAPCRTWTCPCRSSGDDVAARRRQRFLCLSSSNSHAEQQAVNAQKVASLRTPSIPWRGIMCTSHAGIEVPCDRCIKSSAGHHQLTIFYQGQVNVYNNVSLSKIQDMVLVATANDSTLPRYLELTTRKYASRAPLCANILREKLLHIDLNSNKPPDAARPRVVHDVTTSMPITTMLEGHHVTTPTPITTMREGQEDRRSVSSSLSSNYNFLVEEAPLVPRTLPQARKASLLRFLERRKERLRTTSPYFWKFI